MNRTRVFVSFDREHDSDLSKLLQAQSERAAATFEITNDLRRRASTPVADDATRAEIRAADAVLVICGEKTHESTPVSLELAVAQDEEKPYLLLWGASRENVHEA